MRICDAFNLKTFILMQCIRAAMVAKWLTGQSCSEVIVRINTSHLMASWIKPPVKSKQ